MLVCYLHNFVINVIININFVKILAWEKLTSFSVGWVWGNQAIPGAAGSDHSGGQKHLQHLILLQHLIHLQHLHICNIHNIWNICNIWNIFNIWNIWQINNIEILSGPNTWFAIFFHIFFSFGHNQQSPSRKTCSKPMKKRTRWRFPDWIANLLFLHSFPLQALLGFVDLQGMLEKRVSWAIIPQNTF